jgi:DsbC/DsbD-like thiol-disulfide interchange protein
MRYLPLAILIALVAAFAWQADGAAKAPTSDSKVKTTATATKIDDAGKQTVTITLNVAKGWHLYANPVNHNKEFLDGNKTIVKIGAKSKVKFTVRYPEGKTISKDGDKYDVYVGTVKIEADVVRAKGDTAPLEVAVTLSACDDNVCLKESTVKLMVP